jgi:DNA-binding response OmpR family regulator
MATHTDIANTGADSPARTRVLLVDDDRKLCRLIAEYLRPRGFDTTSVHTGPEGLAEALKGGYAALILDYMLPGMDGFEVLRQLRQQSTVPVLMLTALGDESDRIVGLELGADDYLPKTFSTRELLARLRAVTRRSAMTSVQAVARDASERGVLVVGDLRIDLDAREVSLLGQVVTLTALEFDLLVCLARSAGRVFSRDQLLDAISGRSYEVFDRSIDVHVSAIRRKLGDDPKSPRYIRTIRSAGYMLMRKAEG